MHVRSGTCERSMQNMWQIWAVYYLLKAELSAGGAQELLSVPSKSLLTLALVNGTFWRRCSALRTTQCRRFRRMTL